MTGRTLSDASMRALTVDAMNSGLSCYRPDLRYSRADADAYAEAWNASKVATCATVVTCDGLPQVIVLERAP